MGKETNLVTVSIVFGIILTICLSLVISTLGSAYAKSGNLQYEISDCSVQRNSTYEKSGPCTDTNTETNVDKSVETNPIDSIEPKVLDLNPFGATVK
jgi:hypothetical protein